MPYMGFDMQFILEVKVKTLFKLLDIFLINHIRKRTIKYLFKYHVHLPYDVAEFGVYKGTTAWYIKKYCEGRTLHLFDSFEGLPENWNKHFKKGDFKLNKMPELPSAVIHKGLFGDTVHIKQKLSFIHIDSDLYSSAELVLYRLNDNIIPGTVILFDEYAEGSEKRALESWMMFYGRVCALIKRTIHLQAAYLVIK